MERLRAAAEAGGSPWSAAQASGLCDRHWHLSHILVTCVVFGAAPGIVSTYPSLPFRLARR